MDTTTKNRMELAELQLSAALVPSALGGAFAAVSSNRIRISGDATNGAAISDAAVAGAFLALPFGAELDPRPAGPPV